MLWDIDHTLIETRGVGRAIYDRAFLAATGQQLRELARVTGRTELDIMSESLRINGIDPTADVMKRLAEALVQGYEDSRQELRSVGRVLPGAEEALKRLATDPTVYQSVLSGNLRDVSRIKLEVFALDRYLDIESGAYGNDHSDRSELVTIAQYRVEKRAMMCINNAHTVVIGDTLHDVTAAQVAGVRMIAVATGKSTEDDLRRAGASTTLASLEDFPGL